MYVLLFAVINGLYLSLMEITMEGKIFYGVDIICHRTFTTVVIHFHAEVIIESKINIKSFTKG